MGDCPKTKLETQSNTRYSNVNSEQTQNGVESESKSKVFGQTGGGICAWIEKICIIYRGVQWQIMKLHGINCYK